jgi:hypothetical protein
MAGNQTSSNTNENGIIERMKTLDRAWYMNKETDSSKPFDGEPFGNIECMCLEIKFKVYEKSGNSSQH